jgi:UDP-N-acetyl-D-mannosaminuronic acid dehydrogenase
MINVIGLGYIGLPTALMMASHGVEVVGTDYNAELVATLNAGKTTFKEEGLDELFAEAVASGIKFTTEYQVTDTYIVSVPTPYDKFSKKVDPCYVIAAVKEVMRVCPKCGKATRPAHKFVDGKKLTVCKKCGAEI